MLDSKLTNYIILTCLTAGCQPFKDLSFSAIYPTIRRLRVENSQHLLNVPRSVMFVFFWYYH